ncbi:hypothetical protein BC834DRAFT_144175 [Gloeopeniophorella convolvens]|nr:hypothetical protein BC834DRAFT_144175 [Gloeopeniophorella convolvens]
MRRALRHKLEHARPKAPCGTYCAVYAVRPSCIKPRSLGRRARALCWPCPEPAPELVGPIAAHCAHRIASSRGSDAPFPVLAARRPVPSVHLSDPVCGTSCSPHPHSICWMLTARADLSARPPICGRPPRSAARGSSASAARTSCARTSRRWRVVCQRTTCQLCVATIARRGTAMMTISFSSPDVCVLSHVKPPVP